MTRIGINGFGRIGRLVVRGPATHPELEVVHINDPNADSPAAHLLQFSRSTLRSRPPWSAV